MIAGQDFSAIQMNTLKRIREKKLSASEREQLKACPKISYQYILLRRLSSAPTAIRAPIQPLCDKENNY
jgi:hypothetical protein